MSFSPDKLLRKNIAALTPYSSARDDFQGEASVFLDANENPFDTGVNRYPDPHHRKLKVIVSGIYGVAAQNIFLGNGSDEGIDLLFRAFCEPGKDNVVSIHPSYGMYEVCAEIQDIEVRKVLLKPDFSADIPALLDACDENTKLLFLCSPNNPTANLLDREAVISLLTGFNGLVVLDEAYIDFAPGKTMTGELGNYPKLCILRTFSKAWGMAGIRLGMVFASEEIINILYRIKYPYNLNQLSQEFAIKALDVEENRNMWVKEILDERDKLSGKLEKFSFIDKVYPSDANFLLVKTSDPAGLYKYLIGKDIIVRDRSKLPLCEGCLRITIGTPDENNLLLDALLEYRT